MKLIIKCSIVATLSLLQGVAAHSQVQPTSAEHWVSTWATAQDLAPTVMEDPVLPPTVTRPNFSGQRGTGPQTDVPTTLQDQTVRMIVHTSIGGRRIRIELSNAIGKKPVTFGAAHIALRKTSSEIVVGSDRVLTFGGKPIVTVQPGVIVISDPVDLEVQPMADLAVSFYLPKDTGPPTTHTVGLHAAYVSKSDLTTASTMPDPSITYAYLWLSSVDVIAPADAFAVVALGDSITDGFSTTRDADQAWRRRCWR